MFERYNEPARRLLFFARYAASELGGTSIETEHLLAGLIRSHDGVASRILSSVPLDSIMAEIESRVVAGDKVSIDVEIPFSTATKRVLQYAAEDADSLNHRHIGPEHLLLGLLRADNSVAAAILRAHGLIHESVRSQIVELARPPDSP